MAIDFCCPSCGSEIEADETVAGTHAQCPSCKGTFLVPNQRIRQGMVLGGYRIERKLGVGGMGEVWLAQHTTMQRAVALKILFPAMTADPEFVARFMREVQTAAKFEHPHVVTAFDAGQIDGIHFLAVSYVDGEEMGKRLHRQGVIPEKEALLIARGVADALDYVWSKFRVLHRDVKPANIMLTADGTPKLMDMGISKTMASDLNVTLSRDIVGTPHYMSPEQARADENIDFHADVYSLGATLYHFVTGSMPYSGTSPMAVLAKHITEPLESPRKRNPAVSEGCTALIEAMMAKNPKDRPESWEAVIRDIDLVLKGRPPLSRRAQAGRPVVMRMAPREAATPRPAGQAAAVPGNQTQPGRKPDPPSLAAPPKAKWPLIAAMVAAVAGVGLVAYLATGSATAPTVAPAAPPAQTPAQTTDKAAEMWDYAVQFANANPQQFELAVGHFRTVKEQAAGTKYEKMADGEINRLEQAQREALGRAAAGVLDGLRTRAQPLLQVQDYAGAAALYADYHGAMSKETESERGKLAAEYGKQAQQRAETKATDEAHSKVEQMLAAAAEGLLGGKTADAVLRAEALAVDGLPETEAERVAKARDLLRGLAQADDTVLKSFQAQKGRDIDVLLGGTVQRLTIVGTKDGVVQAERQVGPAVAGVTFNIGQLSPEERCRRLQGLASAEVCALHAGLLAHAGGACEEASKLLAGAGVLTQALQAALRARQQLRKDALAAPALARTLQPLGVTSDSLTWPAVSNRLEKAKWTEKTVTAMQGAMESFRKEYGETTFAGTHRELLDQIDSLLASKANPSETPAVTPTPQVLAPPVGKSPYKTPEALNAALAHVNPGYKANAAIVADKGQVVEFVSLYDSEAIANIEPMRGLPLRKLILLGVPKLTDVTPLAGMPLETLRLKGCARVGNELAPLLAAMPLLDVELTETGVTDLRALKGKRLTNFTLSFHGSQPELEVLKGMPLRQVTLYLWGGRATDLRALQGMPIETLLVSSDSPVDYSVIASLSSLKDVRLGAPSVSDYSFLKGKHIQSLEIAPKHIRNPDDAKILRNLQFLNEIRVLNKPYPVADFWKRYDAGEFK